MSLSEGVRSLLAARAPTDLSAAKLLEMFLRADEMLSEHRSKRVGDVELPRFAQAPSGLLRDGTVTGMAKAEISQEDGTAQCLKRPSRHSAIERAVEHRPRLRPRIENSRSASES
jgi:hypothetical protein